MAKEKCDEHSGCIMQVNRNTSDIKTIFEMIGKIQNRPPVWMTLLFSAATLVIGWLLSKL